MANLCVMWWPLITLPVTDCYSNPYWEFDYLALDFRRCEFVSGCYVHLYLL